MGVSTNVSYDKFPKQGNHLYKGVKVCFNYNMNKLLTGTIVRDDVTAPFLTIIKLDDGRHILSSECQYQII